MKSYQNVIIVGDLDHILAVNYENVHSNIRCLEFNNLPIDRDDKNATMLNSLSVLNKYLRNIVKLKKLTDATNIMCFIAIDDKLYEYIWKGTYKAWVKRHTTRDGRPIDKKVLDLWTEFSELYVQAFMDVEFRKLSHYTINKPTYDSENIRFASSIIRKCETIIENKKMEKLEKILEKNA